MPSNLAETTKSGRPPLWYDGSVKRWTLNILTVFSLLSCLKLVDSWRWSYRGPDGYCRVWAVQRGDHVEGHSFDIKSDIGGIGIGWSTSLSQPGQRVKPGPAHLGGSDPQWGTLRTQGGYPSWGRIMSPDSLLSRVGFQTSGAWGRTPDGTAISQRGFTVPYWFVTLLAAALPAVSLALAAKTIARARRRRLSGSCVNCGYDLRASSGLCPECGSAASA